MNDNKLKINLAAIRIKCAEIAGWKMLAHSEWMWRSGPDDILPTGIREGYTKVIPDYPESADAALQLVEWMEKKGWEVMADNFNLKGQKKPKWHLSFRKVDCPIANADAETFQLAACLAFLKANNIKPETL